MFSLSVSLGVIGRLCSLIVALSEHFLNYSFRFNIGIKHGFSCIYIRQAPREVLKTDGFQHLPRDLSNVTVLKKHVPSLLLHKN